MKGCPMGLSNKIQIFPTLTPRKTCLGVKNFKIFDRLSQFLLCQKLRTTSFQLFEHPIFEQSYHDKITIDHLDVFEHSS
jgi:hypothetical protein